MQDHLRGHFYASSCGRASCLSISPKRYSRSERFGRFRRARLNGSRRSSFAASSAMLHCRRIGSLQAVALDALDSMTKPGFDVRPSWLAQRVEDVLDPDLMI